MAPNRNKASDGTIGDAAHQAQGSSSDHNPDYRGIVHAVDLTDDPGGGFDARQVAHTIAGRMAFGAESRIKYLVSNDPNTGKDIIFQDTAKHWQINGSGSEHASHLHISIKSGYDVENSTDALFNFGPTPEQIAAYFRLLEEQDVEHGMAVDIILNPAKPTQGYMLDRWGGVHPLGGAVAVQPNGSWPGLDIARKIVISNWARGKGYVMDLNGGIHPFGGAPNMVGPYWPSGKKVSFMEL